MINIIEANMSRRNIIGTAHSFAEAMQVVEAMGVAFLEEDKDYPNCADAYLNDGRVIAIQPKGFKL